MMALGSMDLLYSKVKLGLIGFEMGKAEKVHVSFAVVLFALEMQSTSVPLNSGGQGQLVTLAKVTCLWSVNIFKGLIL